MLKLGHSLRLRSSEFGHTCVSTVSVAESVAGCVQREFRMFCMGQQFVNDIWLREPQSAD